MPNKPSAIVYYLNGGAISVKRLRISPENSNSSSRAKRRNVGFGRRQPICITSEMHRMKWRVRPDWMHCVIYSTKSSSKGVTEPEPHSHGPRMRRRNESIEFVDINVSESHVHVPGFQFSNNISVFS